MDDNAQQVENFINAYNHLFGLFELTPEPIIAVTREGTICYANSVFIKLFGYEASEFIGKPVDFLIPKRFKENHPALVSKYWEKPFKRPMGTNFQPVGVKSNGEEIYLDISLTPMGEQLVLCFLRDNTENIMSMYQETQQSQLNTMGLLSSSLLHEVSNPTQSILYSTRLIKEVAAKSDVDPYIMSKVEDIEFAGQKLFELLDAFRVLVYSGEDDGNAGSIDEAINIASRLCAHKLIGIDFHVDKKSDIDSVIISTNKLAQVLINLYANASYALFSANIENKQILTEVFDDEQSRICVQVTDNGPGIPTELQDKIFDPSFSTKTAHQGTGLGLSICQNILEKINGQLTFQETKVGASFLICVPR